MSTRSNAAKAPSERSDRTEALLYRYLQVLDGERNLSRFTLRNYTSDLRHYLTWLAERRIELTAIKRPLFRSYVARLQGDGVAQGSVTRRVSTVRSFYKWLRLTGVMHDDPLALVRGPKQAHRLPHVMTLTDITALIAAADGEQPSEIRDRALLEVMYGAGVRVSEAAGIDVHDVSLEHKTLVVRGKGNKQRLVVIGEPARDAIERYLRDGRNALLKRWRRNPAEGGGLPLFVNRLGTRLSQRRIQLVVRKYALKAGLDARVHPHLLRHTFATHLLDGGAELRVVQELLGHANPNTTQIYLHVTEERQRAVLESSLDEIAKVEQARRTLSRERKTRRA